MLSDPRDSAPDYRIDTLRLSGAGHTDDLGREWLLTQEKGWSSGPAPRTNRDPKVDHDGSFRSAARAAEKVITLRGAVHVPDAAMLETTALELAGLCPDGGRLYQMRRTSGASDLTRDVEIDAEPELEAVGHYDLDFQLTFAAPDPRKHAFYWQEPRAWSPSFTTGGLDDSGGGLTDAGGGLDAGPASEGTPALVANYGTDAAAPFFILRGPLPTPVIMCVETGAAHRYRGDVADGEVVFVNCDRFPARGVPAQSAVSNLRGDVSSVFDVGLNWPTVPAQGIASYRLAGTGSGEALTAALRSAYR